MPFPDTVWFFFISFALLGYLSARLGVPGR